MDLLYIFIYTAHSYYFTEAKKLRIVPTKSRDKFCRDNFFFRQLHPHERFQSRQIPSAPDLFTRPASIVAKGFHLQFQGFILCRFRILESPSFAAKDNFCLSSKLISVQLRAFRSSYDQWLTSLSRFCLFSRFCRILTLRFPLRPKFVKSRQTTRTCKICR